MIRHTFCCPFCSQVDWKVYQAKKAQSIASKIKQTHKARLTVMTGIHSHWDIDDAITALVNNELPHGNQIKDTALQHWGQTQL